MTEMITSTRNPKLRELRKLRDRRQRERSGLFMAEGEDLLDEALKRNVTPEVVFFDADALDESDLRLRSLAGRSELVPVSHDALAWAGSLGSGSRLIAVWPQRWTDLSELARRSSVRPIAGSIVFLHDVGDPGNIGTVVRSALAFGAAGVILSPGSADPFGPKAVRASMGSLFGQPLCRASFEAALGTLRGGWTPVALVAGHGGALREVALVGAPCLFVLGSERAGLPAAIVADCEHTAQIAMTAEGAESLNVAMVATLCLYEAALHRLSTEVPAR